MFCETPEPLETKNIKAFVAKYYINTLVYLSYIALIIKTMMMKAVTTEDKSERSSIISTRYFTILCEC